MKEGENKKYVTRDEFGILLSEFNEFRAEFKDFKVAVLKHFEVLTEYFGEKDREINDLKIGKADREHVSDLHKRVKRLERKEA